MINDPNIADPRINNCLTYSKKPQQDFNMASTGLYCSAFHRVNRSSCASNNNSSSFSIRNILNLSEEKSEQYAQSSDDGLPSSPVLLYLPQIPQVVWPPTHVHLYSHCRGLINRQQFRGAQQDHHQKSLTDKKIHLMGE